MQKNKKQLKKLKNLPIQTIVEQKKEIGHVIVLMKSGIKISEDSVDGDKELEACLRSVNLDRNKLISAQSKISMGVKRKGELAHEQELILCAHQCVCACVFVCVSGGGEGGEGLIPSAYHGSVIPMYDQCLQ